MVVFVPAIFYSCHGRMSAAPEWNPRTVSCADSADVALACDRHDLAARERLIAKYIPLVKAIARRYDYTREPYEDLVQVGSIGLIKAIDRFEPARGVDLAAFAVPNILGEIRRYLRDVSAPVRLPRRHQEICTRIGVARRQLSARLQRSPTSSELATAADLNEHELAEALQAEQVRAPVSLSEASEIASSDEALDESEDRVFVASSMRLLHRRERQALRFRYYDDLSQDEIARRLGLSQTHTSRVLASGLAKLRADFEGKSRCAGSLEPLHSGNGDSRCRRGSANRGVRPEAATASRAI
jgi:RNA polymerase sigma-B factor